MYKINCFAPISQTHVELSIQIHLPACRNYNCKQEEKCRKIQYLREVLPPPIKLVAIFVRYINAAAVILHLHNFLVILINGIEANVLTVRTVLRTQLLITPELLDLLLQISDV